MPVSVDWTATIKESKPNVNDSTVKMYKSSITTTLKGLNEPDASPSYFTKHYSEVLKYLRGITITKRKSVISAILAVCDDSKACESYRKQLLQDIEQGKSDAEQQKMSVREKDNWMSQNEVLEVYKKHEKQVKTLWTKDPLTKENLRDLMKFVALSCYVLIPPRRLLDFTSFKLKGVDPNTDNFMKKYSFVFNKYKTVKAYGQQVVVIPPRLHSIISRWAKKTGSEWLLFNTKGGQMSQPKLNKLLEEVFHRKISCGMLRHIFISDKVLANTPDLLELKGIAQDMGQSLQQQQLYKKKATVSK